jgi:membrane-associated PAP2 superfamily phosphatase
VYLGVGSCFIDWFEYDMIYDTKIKNFLMRLIALVNPSNHALMKILVLTFSLKLIMWKIHSRLKKSAFIAFKLENDRKLCRFKQ